MNEIQAKTREDVERLKVDWSRDPIWDIEDTEGFEEYRDELIAYSKLKKQEWARKLSAQIIKIITEADNTTDWMAKFDKDERGLDYVLQMLGSMVLLHKQHIFAALNAYKG